MSTRTRFAALVVLAVLAAPFLAAAEVPGGHRRQLTTLMMAERGFPNRNQILRTGLPEDTNRILTELASDAQSPIVLQLNAVRALEHFPTKRTEEVLMSLLYSRGQLATHKRAILRALARTFGVKMYFEVVPFLRDVDPRVRAGAALALAEIDDGRVESMLMNMLETEPEISVRVAAEEGFKILRARQKKADSGEKAAGTNVE